MSKQTEKSRYPSPYSPGKFVTAAQYIIELICENRAASLKKDLPTQFWKDKEWQSFYKMQLRACHKMLKEYDERAIIKALKDDRCRKTWSLRAPWLKEIIKEKQAEIEVKKQKDIENQTVINRDTTLSKPRQKKTKKSLLDRLEELE